MRFSDIDFARLPKPTAIDPLDFEVLYAERKARFLALWEDYRVANPTVPVFDTLDLETDPVAVLLQENAYLEMRLRQHVNDQVLSVMLPYAEGAELDSLGSRFQTLRGDGESDDRYRLRLQLAPSAFSAAGTDEAFIYHALTAAPTIAEADAYQTTPGHVLVVCRSADPGRVPSADTIEAVRARVSQNDVLPLTQSASVAGPTVTFVDVRAHLEIADTVGEAEVLATATAAFNAWAETASVLGSSFYRSAAIAALHVPGVRRVSLEMPAADVAIERGGCFVVGSALIEKAT